MWSDKRDTAALITKSKTAFNEACCKVWFCLWIRAFAKVFENIILLSPPKVRHVGGDERELAGENFRRLGQAARGHGHFMRGVVLGLLRQRLFQQRLEFMERGHQQIALAGARVDEAAQHRRVFEQTIKSLHTVAKFRVAAGNRHPVGFAGIGRKTGASKIHRRQFAVTHAPPGG